MKNILVLTDFSVSADNTAQYALKFAQLVGADLLLCNIYAAPADELKRGLKKWPPGRQQEDSIIGLDEITAHLKTEIDAGDKTAFRPEIDQFSGEGSITNNLNRIIATHNILMMIISMHSSSAVRSNFLPDHAWEIIGKACIPVLVIPYRYKFKPYRMIAFATDMAVSDTDVLKSLASLAKYSDAEILVTHIANVDAERKESPGDIKKFFASVSSDERTGSFLFQAIKNDSIITGLKELLTEARIDIMVLIRRPHNPFQRIFYRNIVRRLSKFPAKPLLIFPHAAATQKLPAF